MSSAPGRHAALVLLAVGLALPSRAEQTPSKPPAAPKAADTKPAPGPMPPADDKKAGEPKKLDLSTLPADAVLILCERAADALKMVPDAVILAPAKYQEMREEIERLRKQQAERPAPPSRCELRGRVEGTAVRLQAEFSGTAERANTTVALACPQGVAGAATAADGKLPRLRRTEAGGFVVQIDKPGEYHLKLDLAVPLAVREGNGRGFELTLPRAAITRLELDLPGNAEDVRVGDRPLGDPELVGLSLNNHRLAGAPGRGPVDKLELAWKEARPPSGVPVRTAEGRVTVRLDEAGVTTEADLLLRCEGAPAESWQLIVPTGAEVKVLPPDADRVRGPVEADNQRYAKLASVRTIHLKDRSFQPLHVRVRTQPSPARGGEVVPVGPFFVVGAARHTGTVVVRNQVRGLHLDYHEHGDLKLRQVADEAGAEPATVATFGYGDIPLVEKPQGLTGPKSLSWLDLDAEIIRTQVRTRVSHALTLSRDANGSYRWDVVSTITPASKWTESTQLKVVVPPAWVPAEEGVAVTTENGRRCVVFRAASLLRDGPTRPVSLAGRYEPSGLAEGRASLTLPWPAGLVEQYEVLLAGPDDRELALHNAEQVGLEALKAPRPNEQSWRGRRLTSEAPALDVGWRPYRPDVRVSSVVDLRLEGDRGDVRHELRFQLPAGPPSALVLRLPRGVSLLSAESPDKKLAVPDVPPAGAETLRVTVPAASAGAECRLLLRYTTPLGGRRGRTSAAEPFAVPLVKPEQATGGEARVRVWSEPGDLPLPPDGPPWEERGIEEVKGRPELPALVLYAPRPDAPLRLRTQEQAAGYTVLVERALIRVQLLDGGGQGYRARFQLRQLVGRELDVVLPGPVPTLNVQVRLNRRKVAYDVVNAVGEHTEGGNVARLRLAPDLVRQTALLDVSFQLPPRTSAAGLLHTALQPPRLRGAPETVPVCWLVSVPANRVLLSPESAAGVERVWVRRGWLLAARLHRSAADVEHDFEASLPAELARDEHGEDEPAAEPSLLCWHEKVDPVVLTQAPQQAWLLVCSLGLLVVGLGVFWSARPRPGGDRLAAWFWPLLAAAALAAVVAALFWPTALWAVVYGGEPGAVVLLGMALLQWLRHQRYRRQIVFLPSFSRGRAGSSLLRKSASRPAGAPEQPSTVDAPPNSGVPG